MVLSLKNPDGVKPNVEYLGYPNSRMWHPRFAPGSHTSIKIHFNDKKYYDTLKSLLKHEGGNSNATYVDFAIGSIQNPYNLTIRIPGQWNNQSFEMSTGDKLNDFGLYKIFNT